MSLRVWPAREYRGPRSLAVGRGKALLAAQLVWWGARGPSDVTKSFVDYYVTRTPQNQGTLGPALALECKCAFGAKIDFELFFCLRKMCACGAHLCFPNREIECLPRSSAVDYGL